MENIHEITIGRDPNCDIRFRPECKFCSSWHGTLHMEGNTLIYRDQSSNGTTINNTMIHNQSVPLRHGDTIMLAGQYLLDWNVIDRYFPQMQQKPSRTVFIRQQEYPHQENARPDFFPSESRTPDLHKFNWGAFFLYPIWGFFNGCWWAFLVAIFCCWAGLLLSILFGVFGTRLSWQNKRWSSADDFERAQHTWAQWGVGLFLATFIIGFIIVLTLGMTLNSMF